VRAYVINLARSSDRRTHMLAQLAKTGLEFSFVTAIDDRELDLRGSDKVHQSYLERSDWCPGRVGAALSHLRAYEQILADGLDQALVLEDDVRLPAGLSTMLHAVGGHLAGAEVALLLYDTHYDCELSKDSAVRLPDSRLLALPIDIGAPVGAAAYVITREACERMSKTVLPVRSDADDWAHWYDEGALDRVRCVFPYVVEKEPSFESTIDYRPPTGLKAKVLKAIKRYKIPLASQLVSYRRKSIWRKLFRIELVDKPFVSRPSRLD
jgi:glycosyl transferase, family 25